MASYTVTLAGGTPAMSGEKTTSGSTADTATVAGTDGFSLVEVDCTASSGYVDIRLDGSAAVKGAAGTLRVKAGTQIGFPATWLSAGSLSVVGSGGNETYEVNVYPYATNLSKS